MDSKNLIDNQVEQIEEAAAIVPSRRIPGLIEPEDALTEWIPDTLFSSSNDWEIPDLDPYMQAQEVAIPFLKYGEQARTLDMKGNGTVHFYTDDYKFSAIYEKPEKLYQHHPRNIVEPNFSLYLDMAPAFGLQAIYKKRVIARMMQDRGIRVFVDLNVAQKFIKLNLLGVPAGWRSFATRGYSDRLSGLELEYRIAEASAAQGGRKPLFVVYGGGTKCRDFCKEVGAVYITPNLDSKKKEQYYADLLNDNIIAFADGDYSRKALEEAKTEARLRQITDYGNKQIGN